MFSTITVNTVIIRALSAKASKRTEKPRTESSGGIFSVLPSCPTNKRRSNRNRSSTDNNETERQSVEPRGKTVPQTQARTTLVVASMHRRRRAAGDDGQSTNTNAADRMNDQDYTAVPTGEAGDDGVPSSFYGSKKGYRAWFPRSYNFRRRVSVGLIVAVFVVAGLLASLGLGASRGHIQGEACQRQTTSNQ